MTVMQFESLTVTQPPLLSLGPRLFPRFLLVFLSLLFSEIAAQLLGAYASNVVLSRISGGGWVSEMTQAEDCKKSTLVTFDAFNRGNMFEFNRQRNNRPIRGP